MKAVKIIFALALFVCLFDMSYGYYQLVRFAGTIIFGFMAYEYRDEENKGWLILLEASALYL